MQGGPTVWVFGRGLTIPRRKKKSLLGNVTQDLGLGGGGALVNKVTILVLYKRREIS
jgi:hypothetical protein